MSEQERATSVPGSGQAVSLPGNSDSAPTGRVPGAQAPAIGSTPTPATSLTPEERAQRCVLQRCLSYHGQWHHPGLVVREVAAAIREAVAEEREACAELVRGWIPNLKAKLAAEGSRLDLRLATNQDCFDAIAEAIRSRS